MATVSLKKLEKRYGNVAVVHGIDLEVADREFIALVGPSGCGKSTTLRMIAGLEDISGGEIRIGSRVVNELPPRSRNISMVFQSYALYPHMTVKENMGFSLKIAGRPQDEIEKRVAEAARILDLGQLLERRPSQLSGGQRQRVAIGRALVRDVDVFLFDEPLSNLDAKLRSELRVEIKRLHQKLANTMIYVTHDQIEAMTLADRIAVMKGGLIQQLGAPQEIYKRPVNRFVAVRDGAARFVADGLDIPLANYGFDAAGARPGAAALGIRPEHVGINSGEDWPFSARVPVEVVEPMGSDTLVWTRLGKQNLTVRVSSERAPDVGDTVAIGFDPMNASLFDAVSGERL